MSDVVIRVENLYKEYRLGIISHGTLYQDLQSGWAKFRRKEDPNARIDSINRGQLKGTNNRFFALNNVSFDVRRGEVVGIIGRNGAGKSTLLKIISRVTAPTSGTIKIKGRVASLLEVGTGFHPELTGRENIFLNGAILGMRKGEIEQKFDEIVKFAEIDKFIDTPVKRYSSGMYVRLAFAVAAHLDPEILVVDEVLAVGDVVFQKKCLGKMGDVAKEGRTVLFVSHNMPAVISLCPKTILLQEGKIAAIGQSNEIINYYIRDGQFLISHKQWSISASNAPGNEIVRLISISAINKNQKICDGFTINSPIGIRFTFNVLQEGHILIPTFSAHIEDGTLIFWTGDQFSEWQKTPRPIGQYCTTCWIPGNFFNSGTISIGITITTPSPKRVHFHEKDIIRFDIQDTLGESTARGDFKGSVPGVIRPTFNWASDDIIK